ncbi:hypothetical protein BBJ28_00024096 [Nothophytophthora sp. Chile5]|nr:hypothetical protein BBJ28_00024096 [Nothophytophthora sp. Chile5]
MMTRPNRKRPRSEGRVPTGRVSGPGTSRDDASVLPAEPIDVDKDLLVQVLRVKVQAMVREWQVREKEAQAESTEQRQCHRIATELEKLLPVMEQQWLQELLAGDKPRYGFDEVIAALRGLVQADPDARDAV